MNEQSAMIEVNLGDIDYMDRHLTEIRDERKLLKEGKGELNLNVKEDPACWVGQKRAFFAWEKMYVNE